MRKLQAIVAVLLLSLAEPAGAAESALELAPTMLRLKPGEAGLFYLVNRSASAVTVQTDAFDWSQTGSGDRLTPSGTLFSSPPVITIAPNARQIVRVLAVPSDTSRESEYRLVLSQLPAPEEPVSAGVHVLLQFSIPVFVAGGPPAPPQVHWDVIRHGEQLAVVARNSGLCAVKIQALRVSQNGQSETPVFRRLGYILPAGAQEWPLKTTSAAPIHIEALDALSDTPLVADVMPHG